VSRATVDLSTLPERLLLSEALELVAGLCKSQSAAQSILLDHLKSAAYPYIRWVCRKLSLPLTLPPSCSEVGVRLALWQPRGGAHLNLEIYWNESSVVYTGPVPITFGIHPDNPRERWRIFRRDNHSGRIEAHLIRLRSDDVVTVLHYLELLPHQALGGAKRSGDEGAVARGALDQRMKLQAEQEEDPRK
jgi:hypothetical protein